MKHTPKSLFAIILVMVCLVINASHSKELIDTKVFSVYIFDQFVSLSGSCSLYTDTETSTNFDSLLSCSDLGITTEVLLGAPCDAKLIKRFKANSKLTQSIQLSRLKLMKSIKGSSTYR